jgi:ribonuclease HI
MFQNSGRGLYDKALKTSAGLCVRNNRSQYVLGGSSWIHGSCFSNEGQALALLEAMKELRQRGFNNVIFEIDAQHIMYAIRQRNTGVSEFSSIYI